MIWSGGGSLVRRPVVFSPDGCRFLCTSGSSVSVLSVATGEEVQVLTGHTDTVTSIVLVHASASAKGASHCWTSSLDGTARLWDYSAGTLVRTIHIGHPIFSMVIPDTCPGYVTPSSMPKDIASHRLAYLSVWWKLGELSGAEDGTKRKGKGGKKGGGATEEKATRTEKSAKGPLGPGGESEGQLLLFDLTTGSSLSTLFKMAKPRILVTTPEGGLVGAADEHKVVLWDVESTRSKQGKVGGPGGGQLEVDCLRLHHTKKLTALALHSSGTRVTAGDEVGQILEWFGLKRRGRVPEQPSAVGSSRPVAGGGVRGTDPADACTTVHWHSHQVGCVMYGEDGMYRYSGGEESVLVIWQLETGEKTFLPRLGGKLVWMARCPTRPTLLAVSFSDNAIRLIDIASMKVERTIQGLRPAPATENSRGVAGKKAWAYSKEAKHNGGQKDVAALVGSTAEVTAAQDLASDLLRWGMCEPVGARGGSGGAAVATLEENALKSEGSVTLEPREGLLVLPTRNCCLQFWNMSLNRHVGDFQVAPRNYVSTKEKTSGETVIVTHVAFSCDGADMATVERRQAEAGVGEGKVLNFWHRPQSTTADSPAAVQWQLNTRSDEPHRGLVTALAFHPWEPTVVSCSAAGDFKVWIKEEFKQGAGMVKPGSCWRCVSAASYCDQPCTAVAFSPDGSLLAVGTDSSVTLWSPTSNSLLCVLPTQLPGQLITSLQFLPGSPFLVAAVAGKSPALTVFNLLTLSVWWAYSARTQALVADPSLPSHFAAILLPNVGPKEKAKGQPGQGKCVEEGYLVIFEASSPTPLSCWRVPDAEGARLLFPPKGVLGTTSPGDGPGKHSQSLVLVTGRREFLVLDPYAKEGSSEEEEESTTNMVDLETTKKGGGAASAGRGPIQENAGRSAFQAIYGNVAVKKSSLPGGEENDAERIERVDGAKFTQPWGDLLSRSSHVLPPLSRVCPTFLEAMLEKRAGYENL